MLKLNALTSYSLTFTRLAVGVKFVNAGLQITKNKETLSIHLYMKAHQLKEIRDSLKFGDVSTIARELEVTPQTVQNSLRGIQQNETAQLIINHAKRIIQQRLDRIEELKRILAKQRKQREQAGLQ
jgi:hypothetical protein